MPRVARFVVPGLPHHITQRGNRRQDVFFSDKDREFYIRHLSAASKRHGVQIWAYCLMTNHVHFVAVPREENSLADCFAEVHSKHAFRINAIKRWKGHLWQARFGSSVMDEAYAMATLRYVEQNPVRAGMVKKAWDYPWSSAAFHVGLRASDFLISGDEHIRSSIGNWMKFIGMDNSDRIQEQIRVDTRVCRPLGSRAFIQELEDRSGLKLFRGRRGRPRKLK